MSADFLKFWIGQTISNLGSSFTQWAVPLLVYELTKSPLSLGLATASVFVPYLLFGLVLGAWMDRVDRKRTMIGLDLLNAGIILSIPIVAHFGDLSVWLIYGVAFVQSTVICALPAVSRFTVAVLNGVENGVIVGLSVFVATVCAPLASVACTCT